MIRVGRWQVSAEGAVILAVFAIVAVFGVGRCSGKGDGAADANLAHAQAIGYRLAKAYKASRDSIPVLRSRTENAMRQAQRAERRSIEVERRLGAVVENANRALQDTGVSRDTLRAHLSRVTLHASELLVQNAVWRDSVRGMVDAFAAERAGYMSALTLADSTLAAKDSVIGLLTKRAQCRVLWALPCPTRTQAFTLGSAITLTLVLL